MSNVEIEFIEFTAPKSFDTVFLTINAFAIAICRLARIVEIKSQSN